MLYLSQILGTPVVDADAVTIGHVSDLAVSAGEVFPKVTSIAFESKEKRMFMLSWKKYVSDFGPERITLNRPQADVRLSYLQNDELLLTRDLLDKQIVDTQGMKVVRVNDLKLAEGRTELRLLGADVGFRGILRRLHLERSLDVVGGVFRLRLPESLIAWNYIDLLERDLSDIKLSISHRRLTELHPADIADIVEELSSAQRAKVFTHLDNLRAADTISESEPEVQAELVESLSEQRASDLLEIMSPDDAADILGDLPYSKAERLLNLMGIAEAGQVRKLLGYQENSAGGIMTPEFVALTENLSVAETIERLRASAPEVEASYYVYVVDSEERLKGVLSLRDLIIAPPDKNIDVLVDPEVISVDVGIDQEEVAAIMSKYGVVALPVIDERKKLVGVVTADDVMEVMEEESAEDIALLSGSEWPVSATTAFTWFVRRSGWITLWLFGGIVASSILRFFSGGLRAMLVPVFFLPFAVKLADDVSSRSIVAMVHSLERGEEADKPFWRRIVLDLVMGLIIGLCSGAIVLALSMVWGVAFKTGLATGVALAFTTAAVATVGTLVPVVLGALRVELSSGTGPLLSTTIATGSLLVYVSLALLLNRVM